MSLDDGLTVPGPPQRDDVPAPADGEPVNHFSDVYSFVDEYLAYVYGRPVKRQRTDFRWCAQWYRHPEALSRLDALWQAFETLRLTPGTGMSVWWINHAEPTMTALTDTEGTFRSCDDTTHTPFVTLPTHSAPAQLRQHQRTGA
ncbi:DUF4913 domain-containing protein [Solicola sp. PLA-1-18]|uniref:DUF4913 domain-containing protein n=1 Tax=Solicola sp. PLA-1-18 TaxID=3380532 RepID=UPI003B79EFDF